MECVAMGVLRHPEKGESRLKWFIPGSNAVYRFFGIDDKVLVFQQELISTCNQTAPYSCQFRNDKGFYLAVFKIEQDCLMLVCEGKLTNQQIFNIGAGVLKYKRPFAETAEKLQKLADRDPYHNKQWISQDLHENTALLYDNPDFAEPCNEGFKKMEKLNFESFTFIEQAEKNNSYCPEGCTLL